MCGIAGIIGLTSDEAKYDLARMVRALRHRGPDAVGSVFFAKAALGHARLSIVDLAGGAQPMRAHRSSTAVVFNGEIYGYRELRSRMPEYGFRTESDTELLLALYERYGCRLLSRLPGMFAFAIWDEAENQLFCGRDRFGEKPFYYAFGPGRTFAFASEIKAILASGLVRPVLDRAALAHYLKRSYVHPSQTIYANVYTLPPAHGLLYRNGGVTVHRYWTPPPVTDRFDSVEEACEEFRALLRQAVRRQLVADVPVAAFLSGGLDSTTVVSVAAAERSGLRTLSLGFGEAIDERPQAALSARKYGTDHVEMSVDALPIGELLVAMQQVYDEPFGDSSNIPTYVLCREAARHTKVALTGDGGDELLGGYSYWYRPLLSKQRYYEARRLRQVLLRALLASAWYSQVPAWRRAAARWCPMVWHRGRQNTLFTDAELEALVGVRPSVPSAGDGLPLRNEVTDAMTMDALDYMPGDILVKTDRASMAQGLELRAPFLDVDLATFCLSLPQRFRITETETKVLLRRAFERDWPPELSHLPKQGFGAPLDEWLARPDLNALRRAYIDQPAGPLFDIVNREALQRLQPRNPYQVWTLLTLALWLEAHPCTSTD